MKIITSLLCLVYSVTSLAGISGANIGPRPVSVMEFPEQGQATNMVFLLGEDSQNVHFAYGEIQGGQWILKSFQLEKAELINQPSLLSALETSKETGVWSQLP